MSRPFHSSRCALGSKEEPTSLHSLRPDDQNNVLGGARCVLVPRPCTVGLGRRSGRSDQPEGSTCPCRTAARQRQGGSADAKLFAFHPAVPRKRHRGEIACRFDCSGGCSAGGDARGAAGVRRRDRCRARPPRRRSLLRTLRADLHRRRSPDGYRTRPLGRIAPATKGTVAIHRFRRCGRTTIRSGLPTDRHGAAAIRLPLDPWSSRRPSACARIRSTSLPRALRSSDLGLPVRGPRLPGRFHPSRQP